MSDFERSSVDEAEEGDDDAATSQRQCVDCGALAPSTRTLHTLISSKHGWRLERVAQADGSHAFDWRCPRCWLFHRHRKTP